MSTEEPVDDQPAKSKFNVAEFIAYGWPLIALAAIGGAIGGLCGGLAYGVNSAIGSSGLPLPIKVVLNIVTGIVAGLIWLGLAIWIQLTFFQGGA